VSLFSFDVFTYLDSGRVSIEFQCIHTYVIGKFSCLED